MVERQFGPSLLRENQVKGFFSEGPLKFVLLTPKKETDSPLLPQNSQIAHSHDQPKHNLGD